MPEFSCVVEELKFRGFYKQSSNGTEEKLRNDNLTAYAGFDPTASSLHVGSLFPLMGLINLCRYGHSGIVLIGGGTALIGDPSGRRKERPLLSRDEVRENSIKIEHQINGIIHRYDQAEHISILNNIQWLDKVKLLSFLRNTGKHFPISDINRKESIRKRLEDQDGITFTEYAYPILQVYDFLHLYEDKQCQLQVGGSDQWGNITAGIELIRRKKGAAAYGLVFPLLTKSDGTKFCQSGTGNIWLDPERTLPYTFYQHWINTDDRDVIPLIKILTLADKDTISNLEESLQVHPEDRKAQYLLANELTRFVHGEAHLEKVKDAVHALFGMKFKEISPEHLERLSGVIPTTRIHQEKLQQDGISLVELVRLVGFSPEDRSPRVFIKQKGVWINGARTKDDTLLFSRDNLIIQKLALLRKGKKGYHLVMITGANQ